VVSSYELSSLRNIPIEWKEVPKKEGLNTRLEMTEVTWFE